MDQIMLVFPDNMWPQLSLGDKFMSALSLEREESVKKEECY